MREMILNGGHNTRANGESDRARRNRKLKIILKSIFKRIDSGNDVVEVYCSMQITEFNSRIHFLHNKVSRNTDSYLCRIGLTF